MRAGKYTKVTVDDNGTLTDVGYLQSVDLTGPLSNYTGNIKANKIDATTVNSTTENTTTVNASGVITGNYLVSNNQVYAVSPNSGSSGGVIIRQNASGTGSSILQFVNNTNLVQFGYIELTPAGTMILAPANGTVACAVFQGDLNGTANVAINATNDAGGYTLRAARGGQGTTTSGNTLLVNHSIGTTPSSVVATVRSNAYSATNNTNIFVGNIGLTQFTVFANNGAGGAVAAAFSWMAVR